MFRLVARIFFTYPSAGTVTEPTRLHSCIFLPGTATRQNLAAGHLENLPQGVGRESTMFLPSGVPAYGNGHQPDRNPQNTWPLGGSARLGTRPGRARERATEERKIDGTCSMTVKGTVILSPGPPDWSRGPAAVVNTRHLARLTRLGGAA